MRVAKTRRQSNDQHRSKQEQRSPAEEVPAIRGHDESCAEPQEGGEQGQVFEISEDSDLAGEPADDDQFEEKGFEADEGELKSLVTLLPEHSAGCRHENAPSVSDRISSSAFWPQ